MDKVNLVEKFAHFTEQWKPKIVGEFNNHDLVKPVDRQSLMRLLAGLQPGCG